MCCELTSSCTECPSAYLGIIQRSFCLKSHFRIATTSEINMVSKFSVTPVIRLLVVNDISLVSPHGRLPNPTRKHQPRHFLASRRLQKNPHRAHVLSHRTRCSTRPQPELHLPLLCYARHLADVHTPATSSLPIGRNPDFRDGRSLCGGLYDRIANYWRRHDVRASVSSCRNDTEGRSGHNCAFDSTVTLMP
jgi:hypothetical protein